ncbi:head-tail connector protein [Nonlabens sp.]|jgi:uncharacterized phiE125 gp8 family phage protein|uniref:head-tail connector protein n=1 Tax=Nonlabens sp. TaxID=1888209 RepID=UPI0039E5BF42
MDYTITPTESDNYCTLEQALKHLNLDDRDAENAIITPQEDQDEVTEMIEASIAQVENHCKPIFMERDYVVTLEEWQDKFVFPFYPVNSIASIAYKDLEGQNQTLVAASFRLISYASTRESKIIFKGTLPEIQEYSSITITGKCGTSKVPADVKKAVKLLIGDSDTYREDRPLPGADRAVNALLRPYKY